MYAIIQTGGKQLRVQPGEKIRVEQLKVEVGENIQFDDVLLVVNEDETLIGTPHVENSPVFAKVLDHGRGEKNQGDQDEAQKELHAHPRSPPKTTQKLRF